MAGKPKREVSILFYAINGIGLGHLTRLLAIARAARTLLEANEIPYDFRFLTTSEASDIVRDFPIYKIPSKTAMANSPGAKSYTAQSRFFVSNLVAALRPDILVLDTIPEGSFHEFLFMRDYAQKTVFIDRHRGPSEATVRVRKNVLALYDLILVPDNEDPIRYPIQEELQARRHFTGRVHGFVAGEAYDRDQARALLAVPDDSELIYVSAGGGGDRHAQEQIGSMVATLAEDPSHFILAGYGPLYTGRIRYGPNIVNYQGSGVNRFFPALDLAVSAAGYNSYEELLAAGTPTLFFAQEKGLDCQDQRIAQGVAAGLHGVLESLEPSQVRARVAETQISNERFAWRDALDERGPVHGALTAAVHLLDLHARLSVSSVKRGPLFHAAACARDWPPGPGFAAIWRQAVGWLATSHDQKQEAFDEAIVAWRTGRPNTEMLALRRHAGRLQSRRLAIGLDDVDWSRFLGSFLRAKPALTPIAGQDLIMALFELEVPNGERIEWLRELYLRVINADLAHACRRFLKCLPPEPELSRLTLALRDFKPESQLNLEAFVLFLDEAFQGVTDVTN